MKYSKKLQTFIDRAVDGGLDIVIHVEVHLNKYEPLSGSSYIPLLKHL